MDIFDNLIKISTFEIEFLRKYLFFFNFPFDHLKIKSTCSKSLSDDKQFNSERGKCCMMTYVIICMKISYESNESIFDWKTVENRRHLNSRTNSTECEILHNRLLR